MIHGVEDRRRRTDRDEAMPLIESLSVLPGIENDRGRTCSARPLLKCLQKLATEAAPLHFRFNRHVAHLGFIRAIEMEAAYRARLG